MIFLSFVRVRRAPCVRRPGLDMFPPPLSLPFFSRYDEENCG